MDYPGRIIKVGESDGTIVSALKRQLNIALVLDGASPIYLDPGDPGFGPKMKQAVRCFQARHVDARGRPLKQDGEVGPLTWEALFGSASVLSLALALTPLLRQVLAVAATQEASLVRERPRNSNRGPEVDAYLTRAGADLGLSWCCAFVYWCFDEAAQALGRANPMLKTAGCLNHWNGAAKRGASRLTAGDAIQNPAMVKPGMIFIMDHGRGLGHTGLVERVDGGLLTTIEGNTDASKTREGGGVYRLTRKTAEINKGFIDYAAV